MPLKNTHWNRAFQEGLCEGAKGRVTTGNVSTRADKKYTYTFVAMMWTPDGAWLSTSEYPIAQLERQKRVVMKRMGRLMAYDLLKKETKSKQKPN